MRHKRYLILFGILCILMLLWQRTAFAEEKPTVIDAGTFHNSAASYSLSLTKRVSGDQASRDQYFKITLTLTGNRESTLSVDLSQAEEHPVSNLATTYTDMTNPKEVKVGTKENPAKTDFYLQNGQTITILGLPEGAKYSFEEAPEGYNETWTVDGTEVSEVKDRELTGDTSVVLLNEKSGVVPTGIALNFVPYLILLAGTTVTIVAVRNKKRSA